MTWWCPEDQVDKSNNVPNIEIGMKFVQMFNVIIESTVYDPDQNDDPLSRLFQIFTTL